MLDCCYKGFNGVESVGLSERELDQSIYFPLLQLNLRYYKTPLDPIPHIAILFPPANISPKEQLADLRDWYLEHHVSVLSISFLSDKLSELAFYKVVDNVVNYAVKAFGTDPARLIFHGVSFGCALASTAALAYSDATLILENPFRSQAILEKDYLSQGVELLPKKFRSEQLGELCTFSNAKEIETDAYDIEKKLKLLSKDYFIIMSVDDSSLNNEAHRLFANRYADSDKQHLLPLDKQVASKASLKISFAKAEKQEQDSLYQFLKKVADLHDLSDELDL